MVLFIILGGIGVGSATALITMTFEGLAVFKENVQMDKNLNVDDTITGQTIEVLKAQINALINVVFFKDVVVVNQVDNDISVLLGNGDGTFTAQPDVAVGSGPIFLAIGDLNSVL